MEIDLDSVYGDGWYDGFLYAKKIATDEDSFSGIEDCSETDVLEMSERAESEQRTRRNKWNKPDTVPNVEKGEEKLFWIAVKSEFLNPHTKRVEFKTITFLAHYQNRPLEYDANEELIERDDYLIDIDGCPIGSVGWVENKRHCEFEDFYEKIDFNKNYQLLGWANYQAPNFVEPV
ncbi:hypothetical protein JQC92_02560 [Shewanella sp. 202IG2-18]|uniref:hypothetical protein n=1 Tax=Parashewanella hymeniacidonis TaxID=2807618 RepID=UPI0019607130|nr:hypothetical protein [Parashewanella hymeniacidonis]MBM7070924.1 hypothetical protein [Parashewanella hymeniacidonis]